jgi:serine/threonine-protein kinase
MMLIGPPSRTHTMAGEAWDQEEVSFSLPERWKPARLLGRGGQAEVWLAHDEELDEWVAVKVFRPDLTGAARERLRREVRLGRSLQHPNLVRVFELIEAGDRLAVVMEHVPGGSLAQLASRGRLPVAEVVRVTGEALAALEFLHSQGVVHRDVKPSNLLLDAEGRVRLADFGLVRRLEGDADLTRTSMTVGTPFYMSPEQIRGTRAGFPADLYGLGATVYELLAGRAPFTGGSQLEVASQHLQETAPDIRRARPDCPRWLARFIRRLLEKRPEDRWPDAGAARRAFVRRRVVASPRVRRRAAVAAAAVLALGVLAAGVIDIDRNAPASVTVSSDHVAALGEDGRELWRRTVPAPVAAVVGRLTTERSRDVAVVTSPDAGGARPGVENIVVFDEAGNERARIESVPVDVADIFPGFAARLDTRKLAAVDAGRGRQDLVWLAGHVAWYPSVLGLWRPGSPGNRLGLLFNSGNLMHVCAGDVDEDGTNELVLVGLNNPIGFQPVLVIVEPPSAARFGSLTGVSPDLVHRWNEQRNNLERAVRAYVPFARLSLTDASLRVEERYIWFGSDGVSARFDLDGNPEGSPLFGRGPEPRRVFWDELAALCRSIELGEAVAVARIEELFARHAEVLSEPPMRLAADLLASRALAYGGRHEAAAELLGAARKRMPEERDIHVRIAEQFVMLGRSGEAAAVFRALLTARQPGRGDYDPASSLALLGALEGDEEMVSFASSAWREVIPGGAAGNLDADWRAQFAFCRGDFRAASLDTGSRSAAMAPATDVVHEWALLERGTDPAEIARRAAALAGNPEVRWAARALEARALARMGQSRRAAELATAAVTNLEKPARVGIEARLWLAVANRVAADASRAAGDRERAARHAARARQLAPRCWFGSED